MGNATKKKNTSCVQENTKRYRNYKKKRSVSSGKFVAGIWISLDRVGLDWVGLGWTGLGWVGMG